MKTKKFVSLLLTLCMLLSVVPAMGITASADGASVCFIDTNGNYTFDSGEAEYSTLSAAISAVPESGTATIVMLSDVNNVNFCGIAGSRNITLDLNDHIIHGDHSYYDKGGYVFWVSGESTFTIMDNSKNPTTRYWQPDSNGLWVLSTSETSYTTEGGCITGGGSAENAAIRVGDLQTSSGTSTLYIKKGNIVGNSGGECGGAIQVYSGDCVIDGGKICGNTATYGGAIYVACGSHSITMNDGEISWNTAAKAGGAGAIITGNMTINNGTIKNNRVTSGNGGAFSLDGSESAKLTLNKGEIIDNTAVAYDYCGASYGTGGAIQLNDSLACLDINGGTISGNQALGADDDGGGAICNYDGKITITGGVIYGNNTASDYGGGAITNSDGDLKIGGDTIITANYNKNKTVESNVYPYAVFLDTINNACIGISPDSDSDVLVQSDAEHTASDTTIIQNMLSSLYVDNSEYGVKCNAESGHLNFYIDTSYKLNKIDATSENGRVFVKSRAKTGDTVNVTVKPANGYELDTISVYKTGDNSTTVTVTDGKFIMPAYDVTVSATFTASAATTNPWADGELPQSNEIFYTGTAKVAPTEMSDYNKEKSQFDQNSGKGIMVFDSNITSIPAYAFDEKDSLTKIILPASVTKIADDGLVGSSFYWCSNLSSISMPGVLIVGPNSFEHCDSLTDVYMPEATTICSRAFALCTSLKEISMPKAETLRDEVFSESAVEKVYIPKALSVIGIGNVEEKNPTFSYCLSLKYVYAPEGIAMQMIGLPKDQETTLSLYPVTTSATNGTIAVNGAEFTEADYCQTYLAAGTDYTVTATPDEGYILDKVSVNDTAIEGTTFTMPAMATKVSATFKTAISVSSITLDPSSAELTVGEQAVLSATVLPQDVTVDTVWSTSDAAVATVSNGTVTAVKAGTATITATAGDKSAECEVTVVSHTHSWTYSVSGAAFTATCNGKGTCDSTATSLSLAAPSDLNYNGDAKSCTINATTLGDKTGISADNIKYYVKGESTEMSGKPTEAGTYVAKLTIDGAGTAELTFSITQKPVSLTFNSTTTWYNTVQAACDAAGTNTATVKLYQNMTENLTINSGENITLDLNGYVLKGTGATNTNVISIKYGKLTITDSGASVRKNYFTYVEKGQWKYIASPTDAQINAAVDFSDMENAKLTSNSTVIAIPGGIITGGVYHAIRISSNGSLDFKGGTIAGNTGTWGVVLELNKDTSSGGICTINGGNIIGNYTSSHGEVAANIDNGSSLTMNSGIIAYNSNTGTNADGAGIIRLNSNSNFTMTGGTIKNNYSNVGGGALSSKHSAGCTMTIMGGEIINNSCGSDYNGAGIYFSKGTLTLGGNVKIAGNKKGSTVQNVYLESGKVITVSNPGNDMNVGVTLASGSGNVTGNNSANYAKYFTSDASLFFVINDGTGTEQVVKLSDESDEPVASVTVGTTTTEYTSISEAWTAAQNAGTATVKLLKSVYANLTNASGKTITLDLNGYVLNSAASGSPVITNNGTLNVKSSNTEREHYFTQGSNKLWTWNGDTAVTDYVVTGGIVTGGSGGCGIATHSNVLNANSINIVGNSNTWGGGLRADGGTINIYDVNIMHNYGTGGAGVSLDSTSSTFYMERCVISDNYGTGNAGGIVVTGILTLKDCTITDNYAGGNGGGLRLAGGYAKATIDGGIIKGNTSAGKGGGVYFDNGISLTLKGNAVVTGNTGESKTENLYLPSGKTATVSDPGTNMNVGVTLASGTGKFTGTATKADEAYFFSDNTAYVDKYNESEYLELVTGYTVTCADCTGGSVSVGNQNSAYSGETVTVTVTPAEGYALDTVTIKKTSDSSDITETVSYDATNGTFTMPAYGVTVNATFKQAADPVCYIDANSNGSFDGNDVKYDTITAALAATKPATESKDNPTVIRMIADSNENVTIASGRFITLDLNGYVLKGDGTTSVITNYGTLTVTDSGTTKVHYFTYAKDGAWTLDSAEPEATANVIDLGNYTLNAVKDASADKIYHIKVSGGCITGGTGYIGSGNFQYGGGIFNVGTLTVSGNIIGNTATYGGGIYNQGTIVILSGKISGNAAINGGGIANIGTATISGTISGNKATQSGGGIFTQGANVTVSGTVSGNTAAKGGGIYNAPDCTVEVTATCNVTDNTATEYGGGIANFGTATISGTVSSNTATQGGGITNSGNATISGTVSSNTATYGGGIYNASGYTVEVTATGNVTGNTATYGGGIINYGTATISGTVSSNTAPQGGGITNSGNATISGTVSNNTAASIGGGIYNASGCTVEVTATGNVTGNTATYYGGGIINYGTATISGTVSSNTATYYGGGVYNQGTATISGTVSNNTAASCGGGIYNASGCTEVTATGSVTGNSAFEVGGIANTGTLTVSGSVTANKATSPYPSGGLYSTGGTITLSGNVNITGNTTTYSGNTVNANLCLSNDKVTLSNLTSGTKIGVTTMVNDVVGSYQFTVTGNGTTDDMKYFTSDNASYGVKYNESEYLELVTIPTEVAGTGYSASLTLDADIDLTFTMGSLGTDGNGAGFEQSKLKITVDGTEWTNYKVKDGELSGVLKEVVPKDIGTDLHIVITYDDIVIKDFNYSVKAYCEAVFAAQTADKALATPTGKYDKLADLCEALLNYGKYVADYVNKNTDSTINAGHVITFGDNYTFTDVKGASTVLGDYAEVGSEAYLALGSTIKLNFLLKNCSEALENDDPENQNFFVLNDKATPEQIDPNRVKITTKDNDTIVSVDLYASQLATSYTLKLKGVDTSKFCITYGVYNYCSDAQGKSADDGFTDTVKTLCKAIHNYSVAVQAYIASTAQ